MKSRIVIDLTVFKAMLREIKGVKKELKLLRGEPERKPLPKRELSDAIGTPEVLRLLKVTPTTLINYERKGLIKFHKEGRSKIYARNEILTLRKSKGRKKRLSKKMLNKLAKKKK